MSELLKRYNLELFEMRDQIPVKSNEYYVEFYSEYLVYRINHIAEEPCDPEDKSLGSEKIRTDYQIKMLKNNVSGVELDYVQKSRRNRNPNSYMCVLIYCVGTADIKLFFPMESKPFAVEVFNYAFAWLRGLPENPFAPK